MTGLEWIKQVFLDEKWGYGRIAYFIVTNMRCKCNRCAFREFCDGFCAEDYANEMCIEGVTQWLKNEVVSQDEVKK